MSGGPLAFLLVSASLATPLLNASLIDFDGQAIAFSEPVSDFSVFVANGEGIPITYTVTDNLGHLSTLTLDSFNNLGSATFSLNFSGISGVTIAAAPFQGTFDFAIDNVAFTSPVPEPAAVVLMAIGILVFILAHPHRRRRCPRPDTI